MEALNNIRTPKNNFFIISVFKIANNLFILVNTQIIKR